MRPLPAALRILLRGCARLAPSRNSRAGRAGAPCGGWRSALSPPAPPSAGARGPERPSPDLALPGRTAPSRTGGPFSPRCGDVRRPVRVTREGQGQMAHPECGRVAGGRPDEASPQPVRPAPAGRVPGARSRSVRQTSGCGRVAAGFSETRVLSPPRSRHAAARAGPPRLAQPEWLCHTSRAQRACGGNSPRGARDVSLLLPQKLTWEGRPAFAAPASLASGTDGARAAAW